MPKRKSTRLQSIAYASGEEPIFRKGQRVRVLTRSPIGHYRVPIYVRGKVAVVEAVIGPAWLDNEEEGFGRKAGNKKHYYRIAVPLSEVWANYSGPTHDSLRIEVFETWLEPA